MSSKFTNVQFTTGDDYLEYVYLNTRPEYKKLFHKTLSPTQRHSLAESVRKGIETLCEQPCIGEGEAKIIVRRLLDLFFKPETPEAQRPKLLEAYDWEKIAIAQNSHNRTYGFDKPAPSAVKAWVDDVTKKPKIREEMNRDRVDEATQETSEPATKRVHRKKTGGGKSIG